MNTLVQRTTNWAFAAFFGCVSLLGPGWHSVFGDHFHGSESCAHSASAADHLHDHRCALPAGTTEQLPLADSGEPSDELAVRALQAPAHHCPLCHFFGTAQWAPVTAPPELALIATEFAIAAAPARDRDAPQLYLSRAPPRDSVHC